MTMSPKQHVLSDAALAQIVDAIGGVHFGSVQITIHDARVVQIETTRRVRLDPRDAHLTPGGHTNHLSYADQPAGGRRPLEMQHGHVPREPVSPP